MRYTFKEKRPISHYATIDSEHQYKDMVDKLGQLEDIEDEFNIDLITISKALKKGVFFINAYKEIRHTNNLNLNHYCGNWSLSNKSYNLSLSDYGKKDYYGWALTKEELL